jgi:hypothetical protein
MKRGAPYIATVLIRAGVKPLLASKNGGEGRAPLAAQNVEAVPSVRKQALAPDLAAARARFSFVHAVTSMARSLLTKCNDQGAGIKAVFASYRRLTTFL